MKRAVQALTACAVAAAIAAWGFPASAGDVKALTTSQELILGQSFAHQVEAQYPLLRDPVLTWYVNLRGRQMADVSPRNDIPYFFRVVDDQNINAFALPGGHVYLNLGLFQIADREAEVLGVLAHEIGHVVGRHGAQQILRQQWASVGLTGSAYGHQNYYAYLASNLFGQLGFLKMSRDDEREADTLGFQILLASGYDPQAMVSMFEKMREMQKFQPSRFETLWLTHPPTDERIANLKALIAASDPPEGLRLERDDFADIRARVDKRYPYFPPDESGEPGEPGELGEDDTSGADKDERGEGREPGGVPPEAGQRQP